MNHLSKHLSCYILTVISTAVFSFGPTEVEIVLLPTQPVILTNTSTTTINMLCVVHVASQQSILIKIMKGEGIFNGTSFKSGYTMSDSFYNGQSVSIVASKGTQAQVINLGSTVMKATC